MISSFVIPDYRLVTYFSVALLVIAIVYQVTFFFAYSKFRNSAVMTFLMLTILCSWQSQNYLHRLAQEASTDDAIRIAINLKLLNYIFFTTFVMLFIKLLILTFQK